MIDLAQNNLFAIESKSMGKIIHGDCLEVMSKMESSSIKTVVTSPPYNLLNTSGYFPKPHQNPLYKSTLSYGYDGYSDNIPEKEYIFTQRKALSEMLRLISDDGVIFYNHKWRVQNGLIQDRREIIEGFPLRQIIIWHKPGGINPNRSFFLPGYEVIYMICKKDFRISDKYYLMGDVWKISRDVEKNEHPAVFPIELAERCIAASGKGLVLDPFFGSGTVGIAAQNLGNNWIGIEQSEKYCNMAERRFTRKSGLKCERINAQPQLS